MIRIPVHTPSRPYEVVLGSGLLARAGEHVSKLTGGGRVFVITVPPVLRRWGKVLMQSLAESGAQADILQMADGEPFKRLVTLEKLAEGLVKLGADRSAILIALGGGVVCDITGFLASVYMRGIKLVQVPTTVQSQLDAAIGGKTGVNLRAGKNLVGAFHPPAAVLADPQVLATLPLREMRAGFAEIVKHGVIADEPYLRLVASGASEMLSASGSTSDRMLSLIVRSMEIKADIVSRDEREEGLRKTLNFGHTIGHAVELVSAYSLLHGEAVAIGMALESRLAERIGVAQTGTAARITKVLQSAGLPTDLPAGIEPDAVIEAMRSDKKGVSGKTRFALPLRVGAMAGAEAGWTVQVGDDQLREVLHENQQNLSAYPHPGDR